MAILEGRKVPRVLYIMTLPRAPFPLNLLSRSLDHQQASKLAYKSHAYSVKYAHKLVTTRRAIENKNTPHRQVLGASSNPPNFHCPFCLCFVVEGTYGSYDVESHFV
eukprot:1136158-Pelagomonas_calceolata.AAC.2